MKKSTLLISLAAAGLIAFGGYSVLADNQAGWNGYYCYGPQAYSRSAGNNDSGRYGPGYGCGGWRGSRSNSDDGYYYCPGPGYRR